MDDYQLAAPGQTPNTFYAAGGYLKVGHEVKLNDSMVRVTKVEGNEYTYEPVSKPKLKKAYRTPQASKVLPIVAGCGHTLDLARQPRHRNCKPCWTAFFRNQDGLAENLAKIVVKQGTETLVHRFGKKFLTRFNEYVSLVQRVEALQQAYREQEDARKLTAKAETEWAD